MLSLLQGGYYWVSKGSLNTVTHCVCLRSLVVTTWSLYLNKWSEHVIRKGWRKNASQVTPRTQVVRINEAECGGIVTPVKCLTLMECLCLVLFAEDNSESKLQAINTDFTFELFICAAILLENRESLLQCRDEVQLIQFTSRFVRMIRHENPITREGIWMDMNMNVLVKPLPFFVQPSGNTGFEQHTWESRAPFVQLLQALRLGLYEWPLQSTQEQRRGLFLSAPQFSCFKVIATISVPDIKDSYESVIWNRGLISVWSHGRQNMLHLSFFIPGGKCTGVQLLPLSLINYCC